MVRNFGLPFEEQLKKFVCDINEIQAELKNHGAPGLVAQVELLRAYQVMAPCKRSPSA